MPSRLRVPLGWAAGFVALVLARPRPLSLALGLPLALLGEALRLWACGHLEKTKTLATGGPYAHTRNPLYLGSVLMAAGLTVAAASPWVALAVAVYFMAFYPLVMKEEAGYLASKFGADYAAWAAAVPLFVPRLAPAGPRGSRFDWARVRANREWRTALAVPAIAALLLARGLLGGAPG